MQNLKHSRVKKTLVFITDRRPHSTVHRWRPSLSGCRCSYLEQFTPARYFCTFGACLPVTFQDSSFYRAMHFSTFARSWDRMSSVCLSVTLVICDHIGWKSWKLIAQTISRAPSLFPAKRRSTYSQGNMGKFWGD